MFAIDGGGKDQGVYPRGVRRGENEVKEIKEVEEVKEVKEVKEKTWSLAELSKKPEEEREGGAE